MIDNGAETGESEKWEKVVPSFPTAVYCFPFSTRVTIYFITFFMLNSTSVLVKDWFNYCYFNMSFYFGKIFFLGTIMNNKWTSHHMLPGCPCIPFMTTFSHDAHFCMDIFYWPVISNPLLELVCLQKETTWQLLLVKLRIRKLHMKEQLFFYSSNFVINVFEY